MILLRASTRLVATKNKVPLLAEEPTPHLFDAKKVRKPLGCVFS